MRDYDGEVAFVIWREDDNSHDTQCNVCGADAEWPHLNISHGFYDTSPGKSNYNGWWNRRRVVR